MGGHSGGHIPSTDGTVTVTAQGRTGAPGAAGPRGDKGDRVSVMSWGGLSQHRALGAGAPMGASTPYAPLDAVMICSPQGPKGEPGSRGQDGAQVRGPPSNGGCAGVKVGPLPAPSACPSPFCVSGRAGPQGRAGRQGHMGE